MTVKLKLGRLSGLSTDTKPAAASTPASTEFIETDTRKQYYNNGTDWILQQFPVYKKFNVFKVGATTFVTDINKRVVSQNTDTQLAVQAQVDSITNNNVFEFVWDADVFTINNPITTPIISADLIVKKIIHRGSGPVMQRALTGGATQLTAGASFPDQRYIFELNNPAPDTQDTGQLEIDNFRALGSSTIKVGFCKMETGNLINGFGDYIVTNCFGHYMWRVLDLVGKIWHGHFENLVNYELSSGYEGDCMILLRCGGHMSENNLLPKVNNFSRIMQISTAGTYTDCIRVEAGGYNTFRDIWVDGNKYRNSVISLDDTETMGIGDNIFDNVMILDLNAVPTPDVRKAAIYMNGKVWDNYFMNTRVQGYPITLLLNSSGVMRNDIELDAFWGLPVSVTDTNADPSNTIRVKGGNVNTTGGDVAVTHVGAKSRIIDSRPGAEKAGTYTVTANGSSSTYAWPHGLFAGPAWRWVNAATDDAAGFYKVSSDPTTIVVFYAMPPPAGSSLIWNWKAGVYK